MIENTEFQMTKIIEQFNSAFLTHDAQLLKSIIAPDCVMEGAMPPPDGLRTEGYDECYAFWEEMINTPHTQLDRKSVYNGRKSHHTMALLLGRTFRKLNSGRYADDGERGKNF